MYKYWAYLFGFAMVVAHVPGWSQPSIEPKSALLLGAGAFAWGWLTWIRRPMGYYPWAFLLPVGWLVLSSCWSPAPFLGLQRIVWLLAACGIGTMLAEEDHFARFMRGFLVGASVHAALIFAQWVPAIRAVLPSSLGVDPFQGIGRGLFHNTNMAALPLVILVAWVLLSCSGRNFRGHLGWLLPALALTQSRLSIGVCAAVLAFVALRERHEDVSKSRSFLRLAPQLLLSLAWSLTAHRWGWLLPLGGGLFAIFRFRPKVDCVPCRRSTNYLTGLGLVLAVLVGMPTGRPKNAAQTVSQGAVIQGDISLSQRLSYYQAGALAFLDRPLTGQGLGSARPLYPAFVDRNRPAAEIAYGDFVRPNNYHSEPLEMLLEGGFPLAILLLLGLWVDRKGPKRHFHSSLLWPVAIIALMDFPFHNPLGILWVGLTLAAVTSFSPPLLIGRADRGTTILNGCLALGLLILSGLQIRVAIMRPKVEQQFTSSDNSLQTLEEARNLWRSYPYAADLFDLYSKAAIQNAATTQDPDIAELDQLLKYDPFDHHLLLSRAQLARRMGDTKTAQSLLARYSEVAPRDPDRYLRLAKTALDQGKPDSARLLILDAKRQPGFSPRHAQAIEKLGMIP